MIGRLGCCDYGGGYIVDDEWVSVGGCLERLRVVVMSLGSVDLWVFRLIGERMYKMLKYLLALIKYNKNQLRQFYVFR